MPEFVISVMHIDPMEEERCLNRFIWKGSSEVEVRGRLKLIHEQLHDEAEADLDCEISREDISIGVTPLETFVGGYRSRGVQWDETALAVLRYAFVREGAEVLWEDPDGGTCSGPKLVKECTFYKDEDSTVLLSELDGSGETEVYYSELTPKET